LVIPSILFITVCPLFLVPAYLGRSLMPPDLGGSIHLVYHSVATVSCPCLPWQITHATRLGRFHPSCLSQCGHCFLFLPTLADHTCHQTWAVPSILFITVWPLFLVVSLPLPSRSTHRPPWAISYSLSHCIHYFLFPSLAYQL
jgi:hypothetical protein